MRYRFPEYAAQLNVSMDDLYAALLADAEEESTEIDLQGRIALLWNQFGAHNDSEKFRTSSYPNQAIYLSMVTQGAVL